MRPIPRRSSKRNERSGRSSGEESGSSDEMRNRLLDFIGAHIARRGFPPSLREIGKELGCSAQTVMVQLDRLEGDGVLTREPGIPRSIRLASSSNDQSATKEER